MLHRKRLLRSAALVAASATAMVSLAACGSDDGSDADRKSDKGGGSAASGDPGSQESTPASEPEGGSDELRLGDPAAETVEITRSDRTGEFQVTMEKVTVGKPGDLDELNDKKDYEGKVPAWLYATYRHVGGDSPVELGSITDLGLTVEGGERARPLIILLGDLSAMPDDCVNSTDLEALKAGQSATVCKTFLVPADKDIETALLSRGFSSPPTQWRVG